MAWDIRTRIREAKIFIKKYERHLSSGALFLGFVVDNFTLKRIDLLFENILLFSYLVLAFAGIILINISEDKRIRSRFFTRARPWAPFLTQYAFGALLSGFVIFYTRSASLLASWPFLLLLAALFIGNEFLQRSYARFVFHASIFFFLLFSFMIFYVPIIVGSMGALVFLLSGAVSLLVMGASVLLLRKLSPERVVAHVKKLSLAVGGIFLFLNLLYFTNILPPIPLSLKAVGVYHFIEKTDTGYLARSETTPWYERIRIKKTVHIQKGKPLYVFSSVFAPTNLRTNVVHEWNYYDPEKEAWGALFRTAYPIQGGRDGGYRGYSQKTTLFPGEWRVDIKTENGLLIGRIPFLVETVDKTPELEEYNL